ncbi:hypothetical protein AC233_27470 [Burkholderia sp. HB1]|jgi:hypothetical protein|uniref:Uncharacterized protein n=1 Tax=Paraburkholderia graminis (strain ATCC 700544 / DSM 17151 / LMG 18924 / NCIMB 13744 / C4D1M) TaxID=396598 RepID=B1G1B2_PARG4|nr:hypothetical protein AC233_27470 [Burkholderia sp. HB1]EDT10343.1 hypothetical protein BgramDRAFT_3149 [Paraburkholderia graminis C4D1M]
MALLTHTHEAPGVSPLLGRTAGRFLSLPKFALARWLFSASRRYCEVPALSELPAFNGFDEALALSSVNFVFPAL